MNKNTKRRLATAHKAFKHGNNASSFSIPHKVAGCGGADWKERVMNISIPGGGRSESPKRNMVQRTIINTNEGGNSQSMTVHEPLNKKDAFRPFKRFKVKTPSRGQINGLNERQDWIHPEEGKFTQVKPS